MNLQITAQVQTPNGFLFNISFEAVSASQIAALDRELTHVGIKPYNDIPVGAVREPPTLSNDNSVFHITPSAGPVYIPPVDDIPTDDSVGAKRALPEENGKRIVSPSSRNEKVNILKITVAEVKGGPNAGHPKWVCETDTNITFCMFDLDILVNNQYLNREMAMDIETWRNIGWDHTPEEPLPANIYKEGKYWKLRSVKPSPGRIETVYPPKPFEPKNVIEIADIEVRASKGTREKFTYTGKTSDLQQVPIPQFIREQMQGIGYDTSTWDHAEPSVSKTITVSLKSKFDDTIVHVQNPDGVWTISRHAKFIKVGDVLCFRNEDGEVGYHTVSNIEAYSHISGPYDISFEDESPTIEKSQTRHFVCLTKPPEIPF